MRHLGATDMVVGRKAVTLQYAFEVALEPFRTFPFPTDSEVEHHRASRAVEFKHPHARDVDTHMACLALICLLQAVPSESYRYALSKLHKRLRRLAEAFAPEASPVLENLRPVLEALRDPKTKAIKFSSINYPNCEEVKGHEVIGSASKNASFWRSTKAESLLSHSVNCSRGSWPPRLSAARNTRRICGDVTRSSRTSTLHWR